MVTFSFELRILSEVVIKVVALVYFLSSFFSILFPKSVLHHYYFLISTLNDLMLLFSMNAFSNIKKSHFNNLLFIQKKMTLSNRNIRKSKTGRDLVKKTHYMFCLFKVFFFLLVYELFPLLTFVAKSDVISKQSTYIWEIDILLGE